MSTYLLSPAARSDISEIWDYTAWRWSTEQAERYVRAIAEACHALATGQREGRSINDIRPGYFKFLVGSHVLFYRVTEVGAIEVVRVLHQRMDVVAHLD